jgi:hypothetical protein
MTVTFKSAHMRRLEQLSAQRAFEHESVERLLRQAPTVVKLKPEAIKRMHSEAAQIAALAAVEKG